MLALNATSSLAPSSRALWTTAWVVSQPNESTTIIVITLAITAAQTMSFVLLTIVSRRSALSADRLLSTSLSSGVLIFASLASQTRNIGAWRGWSDANAKAPFMKAWQEMESQDLGST